MPRYSEDFKDQIVQKMMPPNAQSVAQISRDTGVSEQALYNWGNRYRHEGKAVPADPSNPETWSGANKLAVVIETAALNEEQLAEYCRRKGLYPEQISRWKQAAIEGNESSRSLTKAEMQALKKDRKKIRRLEKELGRKDKALAEAAALLILQKKAQAIWGGRGRMISPETCQVAIELVHEAVDAGARQEKACEVLELPARTLRRWERRLQDDRLADQRKVAAAQRVPANKLTKEERSQILDVCYQSENKSLPPYQIVPKLADEGCYIASESSFYRILRDAKQSNHRGRAKAPRTVAKPKGYQATKPNQVWSWDITYRAASIRGAFYRLYLAEDIFSRKIVGWEVRESESAEHASLLIRKACLAEGIHEDGLVLHADNGSPVKGATMLATLQKLGIVPSFSRPSVSDDNPYSESLFRTLKYTPAYPTNPFESIEAARQWVHQFVQWYNGEHRHSAIRFVTPNQRHDGLDIALLAARKDVYETAKKRNPARWSGSTRNWEPVSEVWLNPPKELHAERSYGPKAT